MNITSKYFSHEHSIFLDRVSNFAVLSRRMSLPDVHAIIFEWHF